MDRRIFSIAQAIIGAGNRGLPLTTAEAIRQRRITAMSARHFEEKRTSTTGQLHPSAWMTTAPAKATKV